MKLFIANDSSQTLGGGWSFVGNFIKGCKKLDVELVSDLKDCDTMLIPASSMVTKETVALAKELKKKVYLRIDNMPRNSRNRNTGSSRVLSYAKQADGIIFQSNWAKEWIGWWLQHEKIDIDNNIVIYNGIDTDIFNRVGAVHNPKIFLYTQLNDDVTKQWHEAWYMFARHYWREDMERVLWLVGKFSKELREYNFDFFQGEQVEYKGIMETPEQMASIFKQVGTVLIPYYNDACSNTIMEARACGCEMVCSHTGGTPEILDDSLDLSLDRMALQYLSFMKGDNNW